MIRSSRGCPLVDCGLPTAVVNAKIYSLLCVMDAIQLEKAFGTRGQRPLMIWHKWALRDLPNWRVDDMLHVLAPESYQSAYKTIRRLSMCDLSSIADVMMQHPGGSMISFGNTQTKFTAELLRRICAVKYCDAETMDMPGPPGSTRRTNIWACCKIPCTSTGPPLRMDHTEWIDRMRIHRDQYRKCSTALIGDDCINFILMTLHDARVFSSVHKLYVILDTTAIGYFIFTIRHCIDLKGNRHAYITILRKRINHEYTIGANDIVLCTQLD